MENKKTKHDIEDIKKHVRESFTIAEVIRKIGWKTQGSNYKTVKKWIAIYNLDISHFTGQSHNKGKKRKTKANKPIEYYLVEYGTECGNLKKRLIDEGFLPRCCSNCKRTEWLGNAIPLELHHKNGNSFDNKIENLQLLCPNCHSLTPNYRGKNIKKKYFAKKPNKKCLICDNFVKSSENDYCSNKCRGIASQKIKWPDINTLIQMTQQMSMLEVGRRLGVRDNAIRKHIRNYHKNA